MTGRQQEIVDFIERYTRENGYPPTIHEIGKALFADPTGIYYHLEKLRDQGILNWQPNISRTLRLIQPSEIERLREENESLRREIEALREAVR